MIVCFMRDERGWGWNILPLGGIFNTFCMQGLKLETYMAIVTTFTSRSLFIHFYPILPYQWFFFDITVEDCQVKSNDYTSERQGISSIFQSAPLPAGIRATRMGIGGSVTSSFSRSIPEFCANWLTTPSMTSMNVPSPPIAMILRQQRKLLSYGIPLIRMSITGYATDHTQQLWQDAKPSVVENHSRGVFSACVWATSSIM